MEHWPFAWALFQALGMQQWVKDALVGCVIDQFIHLFKDTIEYWLNTRNCVLSENVKVKI